MNMNMKTKMNMNTFMNLPRFRNKKKISSILENILFSWTTKLKGQGLFSEWNNKYILEIRTQELF